MKILALEREHDPIPVALRESMLKAEAQAVWGLQQAGVIREIYFHRDQSQAIIVLECADEVEAKSYLDALPLVKEDFVTFDLFPLAPYPGLSRLFDKGLR
jgi:hypothetical protein